MREKCILEVLWAADATTSLTEIPYPVFSHPTRCWCLRDCRMSRAQKVIEALEHDKW